MSLRQALKNPRQPGKLIDLISDNCPNAEYIKLYKYYVQYYVSCFHQGTNNHIAFHFISKSYRLTLTDIRCLLHCGVGGGRKCLNTLVAEKQLLRHNMSLVVGEQVVMRDGKNDYIGRIEANNTSLLSLSNVVRKGTKDEMEGKVGMPNQLTVGAATESPTKTSPAPQNGTQ